MRIAILAASLLLTGPWSASAEVTRVSIASREVVAGGQDFGPTGPYERLTGRIEFALDPSERHNRAIVDLDLAPRGPDGRVHVSADLYVLRPADTARGNDTLLFEISNRGNKGLLARFNRAPGGGNPTQPADFGDGFLMREGYTLVWVGWEFDVTAGGLRIDAPVATLRAGQLVAPVSVRFTSDSRASEITLARDAPRYPPADPAEAGATLTVRDRFWDRPTALPRERWRFVADASPKVTLDSGFEPGRIYEVTYRATGARVAGVGLAAIRDAASAFRYRSDLPIRGRSTYVFGASQSGRFLRQFLYDGFNADERDRRVFDAVWPHIAGAARGSFNERFAMPISLSPYTATRAPFADQTEDGGLLTNYRPDQRPKIIYTNTSVEYWGLGRAAALTHTSADGRKDLALPDNVRIYLLAGTQHGEAGMPPAATNGQQVNNPTPQANVMRALLRALHQWVHDDAAPPESRYPRLSDGTLTPAAGVRFPAIAGVRDPRTITGPGQPLPFLVPQVDADGNELAGVRVPELAVPLATTTGWNFRSDAAGNPGDIYSLLGSYIPFGATRVERAARQDPRRSIEERYAGRDDYLQRVRAAALNLVRGRYLLDEDVDDVVKRAAVHWDYAAGRQRSVSR